MKQKSLFHFLILFALLLLAACNVVDAAEPAAQGNDTAEPIAEAPADKVSVDQCAEVSEGTQQLIYAAQGICFLYPDNYDVFQGEDGSLTLYVASLMNTEAPLAAIHVEVMNGRSIQEIIPDYPSDVDLATMSFLTIDLGEETAMVLDTITGQDINRRIIAVHEDRVIDIMIARIGPEYGAIGEQAEALFNTITGSFQFIGIEPNAPLLAGPECPDAQVGTTLFTNAEDGFCLLLPDGYAADDSLTTEGGGSETAVYVDSLLDAVHARLFVTVEDANGRSLEEITVIHEAEIETAIPGYDVVWSFGYMLGGVPANQFDQVPGQDLGRQVLLVHNGRLYTLTFTPDDPSADAYSDMQILYDTVMDSFSFLRQS